MRTHDVKFKTRSCSNRFGMKGTRVDAEEERDMDRDDECAAIAEEEEEEDKEVEGGIESVKARSVTRLTSVRLRSLI